MSLKAKSSFTAKMFVISKNDELLLNLIMLEQRDSAVVQHGRADISSRLLMQVMQEARLPVHTPLQTTVYVKQRKKQYHGEISDLRRHAGKDKRLKKEQSHTCDASIHTIKNPIAPAFSQSVGKSSE